LARASGHLNVCARHQPFSRATFAVDLTERTLIQQNADVERIHSTNSAKHRICLDFCRKQILLTSMLIFCNWWWCCISTRPSNCPLGEQKWVTYNPWHKIWKTNRSFHAITSIVRNCGHITTTPHYGSAGGIAVALRCVGIRRAMVGVTWMGDRLRAGRPSRYVASI